MKKTLTDWGNGVSFRIEFELEGNESEAVDSFWPDFTFYLQRGEGWGVIPEENFGGVAWVDNVPKPGGKFRDGIWRGVIYPNGRPNIPNIEQAVDMLHNTATDSLAPIIEMLNILENLRSGQ